VSKNSKEMIISRGKKGRQKMEMVIIQRPNRGIKNRKGEQAIISKTVHRKRS